MVAFALVATFTGCQGGLSARQGRPDRNMQFHSPLAPVQREIRSPADVRDELAKRAHAVRGLKARAEILIGEGGRRSPRQRFEALAYIDPPDFLRVRASQSGAVMFDLLVKGNQATAVIIPEKTVVRGNLADIARAPELLGGMHPRQLFDTVNIEALLVSWLEQTRPQFKLRSNRIYLSFQETEQNRLREVVLRRQDLLVERMTTWNGRRKEGEVRFWAYEKITDAGSVIPVEFAIENAKGGAVLIRLSNVRLDEPRTPELGTVEIPEGFAERSLSRLRP